MTNYYEALGLKTSATKEEIETAYQKLSQKFHPDNNYNDPYFADMFKQIQEAYDVLSDEKQKLEYDEKNNLKAGKNKAGTEVKNTSPVITFFESDKDSFTEGENIKLSWRTGNADKVTIKPFGEVEISGEKIFKPKNFTKKYLTLTLQATNSLFEESLTKTIKIKNFVTEVDFADIEKDESGAQEPDKIEPKVEAKEEPFESNSFAASPQYNSKESRTEYSESFFSSSGRLRRSTYFGRALLLIIPSGMAYLALMDSMDSYNGEAEMALGAIILLAVWITSVIQFIKRLHDTNLSGWFSLLLLIPYAGGLFGLILLFIDGTKGPNQYGPDPKGRI